MSSEEDRQAEAIASEWGIDISLLDGVEWTIDTIVGNDDHEFGYIVTFDKGTDPDILSVLGLSPGEFTRQLSLNAFDQPDDDKAYGRGPYGTAPRDDKSDDVDDDGIYSVEDTIPDISDFIYEEELAELPPGEEYLTDATGEVLTDEEGNPLVVSVSTDRASDTGQAPAPPPDSLGKLPGAAFAADVFAGNAFDVGTGNTNFADSSFSNFSFGTGRSDTPLDDRNDDTRLAAGTSPIAALRQDLFARLDDLEALIRRRPPASANRGHNNPPELLDVESSELDDQLQAALQVIRQVRPEGGKATPDVVAISAQASNFRRIAKTLAVTTAASMAFVAQQVASLEIAIAHAQYRKDVIEALNRAADAALALVQGLGGIF